MIKNEKPSDFLKMGDPCCSIFGKAEMEVAAVCYLRALVASGDDWKSVEPSEVIDLPSNRKERCFINEDRVSRVASVLKSADDARAFSFAWRRTQ